MTFTTATWLLLTVPMPVIVAMTFVSYMRHTRKEYSLHTQERQLIHGLELSHNN